MPNQYTEVGKFIQSKREEIIQKYNSGMSSSSIAPQYGVGRRCIDRYLIKWKTKTKGSIGGSLEQRSKKTYIFKKWSKEMAYWLGFIQADGSIDKDRNRLEITLKESDKDHLLKFCKSISLDKEPSYRKTTKSYRILFSDKEFINDLRDKGIQPNKSNKHGLVDVPDEYLNEYYLGLIDGDGCLGIYRNRPILTLIGSKLEMERFKSYIGKGCIYQDKRHSSHVYSYSTQLSQFDIELLESWISDPLQLKRKKDISQDMLDILRKRRLCKKLRR